jgi:wyosine [tRNA(Phe)-imidazoG37] synthetase (radical SAM superfamily)
MTLDHRKHPRDAGMTYVYPVVSRRSQGVSVGINLNPNNACNWRCVYCQVEGLVLGKAPPIELEQLESELARMVEDVARGDFMQRAVAPASRRFNDIAFSGNGEPTSSPQFAAAVDVALAVRQRFGLAKSVKLVLITNGSLIHRESVRAGLEGLAGHNAEIWFKLDSATEEGQRRLNQNAAGLARTRTNLRLAAGYAPTWIQSLFLAWNGEAPSEREREAYLEFLADEQRAGTPLAGVFVYGLARQSHQPEAPELSALPREWLEDLAQRVRALELEVRVFP